MVGSPNGQAPPLKALILVLDRRGVPHRNARLLMRMLQFKLNLYRARGRSFSLIK